MTQHNPPEPCLHSSALQIRITRNFNRRKIIDAMSEGDSFEESHGREKRRKRRQQSSLDPAAPTTETEESFIGDANGVRKKNTKKKDRESSVHDSDERSEGKKKHEHLKQHECAVGETFAFGEAEMFSDKHTTTLSLSPLASDELVEASEGESMRKKMKKRRIHGNSSEAMDVRCVEQTEDNHNIALPHEGRYEREKKLKEKEDDQAPKYPVKGHKKKHEVWHGNCSTETYTLPYSGQTREDDAGLSTDKDSCNKLVDTNEVVMSEAGDDGSQTTRSPSRKKCRNASRCNQVARSPVLSSASDQSSDTASQRKRKTYKTSTEGHVDSSEERLHLNLGYNVPHCNVADSTLHKGTSAAKSLRLPAKKKKRKLADLEGTCDVFLCDDAPDITGDLSDTVGESSLAMPVAEDTDESVGASSAKKMVELHTLKKVANNKIPPEVHAGMSSFAAQSPEKASTNDSDALFSSDGDDPGTCGGDMSYVLTLELTPHSAASPSLPSSMSSSRKCTPVSKTTIMPKPCKQSHMEKAAEFNDLHTEPLDAALSETAFRKDGEKSSFPTDPEFLDYLCGKHGYPSIHEKTKPSPEALRCYEEETGIKIDHGKYTAKEDHILLKNIYGIANYYNIRYPYMIVGHCGDHDPALQKQVKDLVKHEKLLRMLGRGLPCRTIHSAYMRARILLNPLGTPGKAVLTPEQKKQVLSMYDRVGPKWTEMAQKMGLSAEQLRSAFRFFKLKETFATGKWEKSEDDLLKEAVQLQTHDHKARLKDIDWQAVASHVRSRNVVQCKRRWTLTQLDRKRRWSRFDSIHLICIMHELNARRSSEVDWETVAELFPWAQSPMIAKYHWESTLNFYLPADKRKDFQSKVKNLYKLALPSLLEKYGKGKTLDEIIKLSKTR